VYDVHSVYTRLVIEGVGPFMYCSKAGIVKRREMWSVLCSGDLRWRCVMR
jgi:hypothetical protein